MKYKRIWITEQLQLVQATTHDQLIRLIQHFYLNVTINYWVFVINCDPNVDFGQMMRQKYVVRKEFMWKIHSYITLGMKKSNVTSSVTNYWLPESISKVTLLLLKGVTSNE